MGYENIITKEYKPRIESLRDDLNLRKNKEFFWPTGTQVYVGRQGSGKTVSAVKHVLDLKLRYPQMVVVSNIHLATLEPIKFDSKQELKIALEFVDPEKQYVFFSSMEQLSVALVTVNNGYKGVTYVIDEIHTYFNALDSKNIPMYVFTEISQQRKQRKLIIGTSQLFLRMAKPLREQCDNLIICETKFGILTSQRAYDGMSLTQDYDGSLSGNLKKKGWFFQTRKIRKAYNTYQKVVSGQEQYESMQPVQIMEKTKKGFKIK